MHQSPPPPSSLPQTRQTVPAKRKAKALPTQVLDQCTVCLEEQLYSQAFSLLLTALTSGTGNEKVDAHVPPIQHLAFAATLIVHPQLTTRTTSAEKHNAADDALRYLRHVISLVEPRDAGLNKAFRFAESNTSSRVKRARTKQSDIASGDEDDSPGQIRSTYTDKESIWTNADDFWSVVGWAFNCYVAHPHRWARWKLWLDLMFDGLEADLEARLPEATKAYESGGTIAVKDLLKDSLFATCLNPIGEGRNNKRRVMRAILAEGKQKDLAEFPEIWRHETKPPKQKREVQFTKKRKLDLENGEFGDYFDDESEEESPLSSARCSRSATAFSSAHRSRAASKERDDDDQESDEESFSNGTEGPPGVKAIGGMDSINFRQRILALLARFCSMNPEAFLDNEDLFDLYTEFLRPLPLPIFQQFVLPMKPYLGPNSQASLNQMLLRPLLQEAAPPYDENALTQEDFEKHYAPFAASNASAVDNAKVSFLLENLLRLLWTTGGLQPTTELRELLEQGITARKQKVSFDGRRKAGTRAKADEEAMVAMECSAERMLMVLDMAE